MIVLSLVGGLLLLVGGGEALVRGAVDVAKRLGVSPLVIGLTLVGFGTSTPELVTSLQAASIGSAGIAVGNVVGSNIANVLLIVGVAALLKPVAVEQKSLLRDGFVMLAATAAAVWFVLQGSVGRIDGLVLVAALLVYLGYLFTRGEGPDDEAVDAQEVVGGRRDSIAFALILVVGGLAATIFGARLLVDGSVELARGLGVSETVIGLTIVAVGTSLPELVTSVMAAFRGQSDIAFGNVVGSNIYNILGILGLTGAIIPIPVDPQIAVVDIWVMTAAAIALVVFAVTGARVCRREGALLLLAYGGYMGWLIATA
ncbi:MAG: calcium/sodium antiporter [Hyphomicrobiaceae bacterium]